MIERRRRRRRRRDDDFTNRRVAPSSLSLADLFVVLWV
jgi:hypothetical protein